MPAFDHGRYYVHQDLEAVQSTPRRELLVQAKPIPRSRPVPQGLPKLPPLYSYPRPSRHGPTDSTSVGSSDWLARSEPSERSAPVSRKTPAKQPSTARSLPSLPSRQRKEPLKVTFVSASDLQDLVQFTTSPRARPQRHTSRLPPLGDNHTVEKQPAYAWSHKPLIKGRQKAAQRGGQHGGQEAIDAQSNTLYSPRGMVSVSVADGRLEGKRTGVVATTDRHKAVRGSSHHQHHALSEQLGEQLGEQDDLSDDELDSASALFPLEEDRRERRERFKRKLLRNAIDTLERYEARPADPLQSLSSIKQGRSAGLGASSVSSSKLPLAAIPEGENEPQEEQLSEDGASSYSSGSRGSGSGRRPLRDRHRMNIATLWRPKSPAIAKPGLAMIPENDQGNVAAGIGGGAAASRVEAPWAGSSSSYSPERITKPGLKHIVGDTSNVHKQRPGYRGLMPSPALGGTGLTPARGQVVVNSPLPGAHRQDSKTHTRIQQFRDKMTSKQKPKQVRFLKT